MLSKEFRDAMKMSSLVRKIMNSYGFEWFNEFEYDDDYFLLIVKLLKEKEMYEYFGGKKTFYDGEIISLAVDIRDHYDSYTHLFDEQIGSGAIERGLMFGDIVGYDEGYALLAEVIWEYDGWRRNCKFTHYSDLCKFLYKHKRDYLKYDHGQIVDMIDRM